MKAAVVNRSNGGFDIEDIRIDAPRRREVLVEVKACGLCHSDLHMAEGNFGIPLPAVFGHELAGIVKEVGPDVREFSVGDHVVGSLVRFCGHCDACFGGFTFRCLEPSATLRVPGEAQRLTRGSEPVTPVFGTAAFAEYALIHENQLVLVPKEIPFPQAAILGCGTITGAGAAIHSAAVRPGETIVVFGAGGVGLNLISGAKLAGAARIIVIDIQRSKEALARKFGATDFVCPADGDPVAAVMDMTRGGVDHAFEVIGLPATTEQALRVVRVGGSVNLIGLHKPGTRISIDVTRELIGRQVTMRGVYMGAANIKRDIPRYAELYLQGRLNLDDLVSRQIRLDEINEAYGELKRGEVARSIITSF